MNAITVTRAALDREHARIMADFSALGDLLTDLNEQYAELNDLDASLRDRTIANDLQLPLSLRVAFMLDIAKAVAELHSASPPILHNDLRSPNVFAVSMEPDAPVHCKLGDFGLAQRLYGSCCRRLQTWQWLAPEVLRGESFDLAADVFSMATMFWELLHGPGLFVPYDEWTLAAQQIKQRIIQRGLRPSIAAVVHQRYRSDPLYGPVVQLIADCWRTDPTQRPSASQVVSRLGLLNRQTSVTSDALQDRILAIVLGGVVSPEHQVWMNLLENLAKQDPLRPRDVHLVLLRVCYLGLTRAISPPRLGTECRAGTLGSFWSHQLAHGRGPVFGARWGHTSLRHWAPRLGCRFSRHCHASSRPLTQHGISRNI